MTTAMNPRIDYMERGLSEPRRSPFARRENYPTNNANVEEGKGFYSMNRSSSPYPSPPSSGNNVSYDQNINPNPSIWDKFRKTIGLGGKRRLRSLKSKKSKKVKKVKKTKKSRKPRKTYKKSYKRGGTMKKVIYGGSNVVNPYSPPMDFAPVSNIPTAQPHNMVG